MDFFSTIFLNLERGFIVFGSRAISFSITCNFATMAFTSEADGLVPPKKKYQ